MAISTKHYLWLGNFLILGLLVWSGVALGMFVTGQWLEKQINAEGPVTVDMSNAPKLKNMNDYEAIASYNIFRAKPQAENAQSDKPSAPKTPTKASNADFNLKGTIVDQNSGFNVAIIEDRKNRNQELYKVGERVGDFDLIEVAQNYVTLKQGDNEVRLELEMEETKRSSSSRRPSRRPPGPPRSSTDKTEDPIAESIGPDAYVVDRNNLSKHMNNLNSLMSNVVIQPFFKEGKPYGFKVARIKKGSPVDNLGFERGDIVLKVNDNQVGKPEDLISLYNQLQQLEEISVEVERGGSPRTLTYSFR